MLRPARHLARQVILALAVVGKAERVGIEGMKARERIVHGVVDRDALGVGRVRHLWFPDRTTVDEAHDVEGSADHRLVRAVQNRLGHRETLRV